VRHNQLLNFFFIVLLARYKALFLSLKRIAHAVENALFWPIFFYRQYGIDAKGAKAQRMGLLSVNQTLPSSGIQHNSDRHPPFAGIALNTSET
jgi:hypothetical protein